MPNLDELKAQLDKISQEIEKMNGEEWPKDGDLYFIVNDVGNVGDHYWDGDDTDKGLKSFLGIYRTKAEAEAKLAVVKATMSPTKRWVPNLGEEYWFVNDNGITQQEVSGWEEGETDHYRLATNNVHKTKEEAEAYARLLTEYGKSIVK